MTDASEGLSRPILLHVYPKLFHIYYKSQINYDDFCYIISLLLSVVFVQVYIQIT